MSGLAGRRVRIQPNALHPAQEGTVRAVSADLQSMLVELPGGGLRLSGVNRVELIDVPGVEPPPPPPPPPWGLGIPVDGKEER